MFKCTSCGELFEDPISIEEVHTEFPIGDPDRYEHWAACPHCKSTDIEEVDDD